MFATTTGREKARSRISRQMLRPALDRANQARVKAGRPPIARASCHDLRRTFCVLAFAAGASPAAVMNALGHTSAALSLEVWAGRGWGDPRPRRVDARLVRGPEWAPMGTNSVEEQFVDEAASDAVLQEVATWQDFLGAGDGIRTRTPPRGHLVLSQARLASFATPAGPG